MKKGSATRRIRMIDRRTRLTNRKLSQFISIGAFLLAIGISIPGAEGSDRNSAWNEMEYWTESIHTSPFPVTPELLGQTCPGDLPDGTCPSEKLFGKLDLPFSIPDKLMGNCPTVKDQNESSQKSNGVRQPRWKQFKSLSSRMMFNKNGASQKSNEVRQPRWKQFKSLSSRMMFNKNQSHPQTQLVAIDPIPFPSPSRVNPGQAEQCPGDIPGGTCPAETKDENGNYIYDTNGDGRVSDSEREVARRDFHGTETVGIIPLPSPSPVNPGQMEQCPGDKLFGKVNLPFRVPDKLTGKCPGNEPKDEHGNCIPRANNTAPSSEPQQGETPSRWNSLKVLFSGATLNLGGSEPSYQKSHGEIVKDDGGGVRKDNAGNSRVYELPAGWTKPHRESQEQAPKREDLAISNDWHTHLNDSHNDNGNGSRPIPKEHEHDVAAERNLHNEEPYRNEHNWDNNYGESSIILNNDNGPGVIRERDEHNVPTGRNLRNEEPHRNEHNWDNNYDNLSIIPHFSLTPFHISPADDDLPMSRSFTGHR